VRKQVLRGNRLFTALEYLRIRKFDQSTPEGRQIERYQRGLLTSLANLLSKGSGMIVLVISVPLTLPYLGQERFGIWMTLASLTSVFSFFDFGIGSAILNAVARKSGKNCHEKSIAFLATYGIVILSTCSGMLFLFLSTALIVIYVEFFVFDFSDFIRNDEIFYSLLIFILLICLNIPITAAHKVYLGIQKGYIAYIFNAISNLISIILLVFAPYFQFNIPELIFITLGIQIISSIFLVVKMYYNGIINFSLVDRFRILKISFSMFKSGSVFFALQFAAVLGWSSDLLLISLILGPAHSAVFGIAQRMFQFVTQPVALLLLPLWATYAEASARGDRQYIRTTLLYSIAITFGVTLFVSGVLFGLHQQILEQWVGDGVAVPQSVMLGFALWTVIESCGIAFAMFLNGTAVLRPQLFVTTVFCLIVLPLKIYGLLNFGLPAVIYSTITAYVLAVIIPYATIFRQQIVERLSK
jgi:O-antigen/teichoic acid export membrane protein